MSPHEEYEIIFLAMILLHSISQVPHSLSLLFRLKSNFNDGSRFAVYGHLPGSNPPRCSRYAIGPQHFPALKMYNHPVRV